MNTILSRFSIENFSKNVKAAFLRFPLSFFSSVVVFFIFIYLIYNQNTTPQYLENILLKSILSIVTVYFLSIWIYFLDEKYKLTRFEICSTQLLSILFWVFFYFSFEQNLFNNIYSEELIYIIITFIWVISFIFFSPFLRNLKEKRLKNDNYYSFFNDLFSKILMSLLVWFSLSLLWFIAISSIYALFDINKIFDQTKIYQYWMSFSLSLFAPIYFLVISPILDGKTLLFEKIKEYKFYNFLSNYIALPFIIIYFVILYAYSIKVLSNFSDWPKGIISWMVIWFSLFWYLIYIFSYAFELKSTFVRIFRKVFPFAVLFQTPMLFYAIYLRINQYDFTINRYLVVVFWIFLVLESLYFIFSNKKYLLSIPLLLTLFIIVISVWPWWVYNFPENRQLDLLKSDLVQAKILQWDKVVLLNDKKDIDAKLSGSIFDKVTYLCEYHGCDSLERFFPDLLLEIKNQDEKDWTKKHEDELIRIKKEIEKSDTKDELTNKYNSESLEREEKQVYTWINYWDYKSKLIEKLKVEPYYENNLYNSYFINYSLDWKLRSELFEITWYDYIFPIMSTFENRYYWKEVVFPEWEWNFSNLYYASIDINNEKIILYMSWSIYEEFDVKTELKNLYELYKDSINNQWTVTLDKSVIFEKKWKKVDLKIILIDFPIKNPNFSWKNIDDYYYVNWRVLLRKL